MRRSALEPAILPRAGRSCRQHGGIKAERSWDRMQDLVEQILLEKPSDTRWRRGGLRKTYVTLPSTTRVARHQALRWLHGESVLSQCGRRQQKDSHGLRVH